MNDTTCSKYLIIEYFAGDEYSSNTSKHYVMRTDKDIMTHASAV